MHATAPSPAMRPKRTRHPACSPSQVPSGMPSTGARAVPIERLATTRPRTSAGTIRSRSGCDRPEQRLRQGRDQPRGEQRLVRRSHRRDCGRQCQHPECAAEHESAREVLGEPRQRDGCEDDDGGVPGDQESDLRAGAVEVSGDDGQQADRQHLDGHVRESAESSMTRATLARRDVMGMISPVIPVSALMEVASHP